MSIFGLPWCWVGLWLLLNAALIPFTAFMARRDVRLKTLREAAQRERHRDQLEYMRGKVDGLREAALTLWVEYRKENPSFQPPFAPPAQRQPAQP